MEFGLNLYSIRNLIQTEEEFLNVAVKLKEMGYSYMQFSGSPLKFDAIKRVVDSSGMPIYLTHTSMDRIVNDTNRLMEEHALFGCKNIGLGMMPFELLSDEKKCRQTIEQLNQVAFKMSEQGFKFFYHHHHYEFFKHSDKTVFDIMIEDAPYINFIADTYWLQFGGVDVCDFLKRLNGRIDCVHLKDYKIAYHKKDQVLTEMRPDFAPLGDGSLDFKKIVNLMQTLGVRYYFVEQDNAALMSDGLNEIAKSAKYIKENL